ncbi:MAG: SDR family oxidoreductase, partial [Acidobacteriota bacterium]
MEQRVALITGGIRGIGRAAALELAARGWAIATTYRTSRADADSLATEIGAFNLCADVSRPEEAERLVSEVCGRFGRIDALINCAGPYHRVHILEETVEGWLSMFDNNLHPVFYLSREAAKGMKERGWGRIVNFSMANADQTVGQPYVTAHYIAKVGVLVLTRTLAKVMAPHGITVNAISPGFIESGSAPMEELARVIKNIPAGYVGSLQDAVSAICYLLSDEARYVNGAN